MFASLGILAVILGLYVVSAFMSGSEASLFSLKPHQLEHLGAVRARTESMLRKPRHLLIVILCANLAVNTMAASLAERLAHDLFGTWGIPVAIALAGLCVLIFGEVVPQTFAMSHNVSFARFASPLISILYTVSQPIVMILYPLTRLLTRRLEGSPAEQLTEEDITALVVDGEKKGALDQVERRWIHSIFMLDKRKAIDLMIPRERIFALPKDVDFATALEAIRTTHYSRIPLYAGSIDTVIGVLYAKDMLAAHARGQEVKPVRIAREPLVVPRWRRCDYLLNELRARKTHLAIVVDEFGATVGILTLENILEAIVGRIRDERREGRK